MTQTLFSFMYICALKSPAYLILCISKCILTKTVCFRHCFSRNCISILELRWIQKKGQYSTKFVILERNNRQEKGVSCTTVELQAEGQDLPQPLSH